MNAFTLSLIAYVLSVFVMALIIKKVCSKETKKILDSYVDKTPEGDA